ncbi:MAG: chorismate synthase [Clostridia bacterium]|nr:chorismate synthase [Clostridia bacterium]
MKNTFGQSVSVTLFGESHGSEIGAVLDGLAPGVKIDEDFIRHQLSLRRPHGKISTARIEDDEFRIVSGVFEGRTTGTPLCILIPNTNTRSGDYAKGLPRPGHADYTAECKYHGYQDYRGGGHFSGRLTAALVAAGAIAISMLKKNGISVGTHISELAGIPDRPFCNLEADIETLGDLIFPVLSSAAGEKMQHEIEAAANAGDSVGGILETAVVGLPAGVGEPWFDTVEGLLAHALFSIPAIKGVEFGAGFGFASMRGSEANDGFRAVGGRIVTATNHNGGINGGITNGMPVVFRCVVKPTPSVFTEQDSVDLKTRQNATLTLKGRHDPAIIHRARVVVDSVTALVLCDLLAGRFGTDFPDADQ